jgi:opacity protein-like surface antigen
MKRLLVIIVLFVLCASKVQAESLNKYSEDGKVVSALQMLHNIGADVFFKIG